MKTPAYTRGKYATKHQEAILKEIQILYPQYKTIKEFLIFAQDFYKMGVQRLQIKLKEDLDIDISASSIYRFLTRK